MRIPGIPYHQGRNNYSDRDGIHYGIAIHNTSNTASDTNEANYADHRTDGTSSHFYVDRDSVTQSLDTTAKAGHAGSGNGNENAIAFEITGTNDKSRDWWLSNVAWSQLGYVIAYILRNDPDFAGFQVRRASVAEMQSNPKVRAIYGHDDMRRAWGGTTHTDPGPNFPWDRLFEAVNSALGGAAPQQPSTTTNGSDSMSYVAVGSAIYLIGPKGPRQVNGTEWDRSASNKPFVLVLDSVARLDEWTPEPPAAPQLTEAQFADLKASLSGEVGLTGDEVEQALLSALSKVRQSTTFTAA